MEDRLYQSLFDRSSDPMLLIKDDHFVACNQAVIRLLGYQDRQQVLDCHPSELSPERQPDGSCSIEKAEQMMQLARSNGDHRFEWVHRSSDGEDLPVEVLLTQISHQNEPVFHVVLRDLRERVMKLKQLALSRTFFDNTSDAILITDQSTRIIDVNPTFCQISGYSREEAIGRKSGFMKSGRHQAGFYQNMWNSLEQQGYWEGEVWDRNKDGRIYPKYLKIEAITNDYGDVENYIGVFTDISKQKAYEQELHQLLFYDPLTQLPNRRLLLERIEQQLRIRPDITTRMALIAIDIDNFKQINDTQGHLIGDELITEVAKRIHRAVSEVDTFARMGGDEFMMLTDRNCKEQQLSQLIEQILATVQQPFRIQGNSVDISLSLGISLFPKDGVNGQSLIAQADMALQRAKQHGGNQCQFYARELGERIKQISLLEQGIKTGLAEDRFVAYFQPKLDLASGRIRSFEALARWDDPDHGLVSPASFIPIAEKSTLICQITERILAQACNLIAQHPQLGEVMVSVNICAQQLHDPNLYQVIISAIEKAGIKPQQLELEVTESTLMEDFVQANKTLTRLRQLGVSIALDDFGTGYSSLNYLKRFPLDLLKIDKSFIQDIDNPDSVQDRSIVRAIIEMAQSLGLKVVAEGVERPQQLAWLQQIGCNLVQGYHIAAPMPAAEAIDFVVQRQCQNTLH